MYPPSFLPVYNALSITVLQSNGILSRLTSHAVIETGFQTRLTSTNNTSAADFIDILSSLVFLCRVSVRVVVVVVVVVAAAAAAAEEEAAVVVVLCVL